MKNALGSLTLVIVLLFAASAIAADKVVVVPLGSSKVAGNNGQVQYNDDGMIAGAEVYYDKTNIRVGIGTDTPVSIFQIIKDGESSGQEQLTITKYDNLGAFVFRGQRSLGSKSVPLSITDSTTTTGFVSEGYDGDSFEQNGQISFVVDGPVSDGIVPGRILFNTTDITGSYNTNMAIRSDGHVGIGTSEPQSKLQVNGYIQLDIVTSTPPSGDCDEETESGRMIFESH